MATTISQSFQELKENLQITGLQAETVSTRQTNIRKVLKADLTVVDDFLTGSYSRGTMISPLDEADIDIFAVLDNDYYHRYNGQNGGQGGLLDLVKRTLRKTYTRTPDISRNGQAVTIRFDDFVVDAVPAFNRKGGGYLIPNSITQTWLSTNPKLHVSLTSQSNTNHEGDYVPLVKMIKAWNRSHSLFFRSFHLEVLALGIFDNATISDYPSGVRFFFQKGIELIDKKNPDPEGYNDDVGQYLNNREKIDEAIERFQKAYNISSKAEELGNDGYIESAVNKWRVLFGDFFPAYG